MLWITFKRVLLEELCNAASKLEGHNTLYISRKVTFEVANMVEAVENAGFKVDWIDQVLGTIQKVRDHHELIQIAYSLRGQMEEIQKKLRFITDKHKQVKGSG